MRDAAFIQPKQSRCACPAYGRRQENHCRHHDHPPDTCACRVHRGRGLVGDHVPERAELLAEAGLAADVGVEARLGRAMENAAAGIYRILAAVRRERRVRPHCLIADLLALRQFQRSAATRSKAGATFLQSWQGGMRFRARSHGSGRKGGRTRL